MVRLTGVEVSLDDELILLLVAATNHQVVLTADEPQELLKPDNTNQHKKKWTGTNNIKIILPHVRAAIAGYLPVCLTGLVDGGHCLDVFQRLLSLALG